MISDTRAAGPLSRVWEFVTERIMGFIARRVTSKQYPFSQLSNTVKRMEQLKMLGIKYNINDKLRLTRPRRNWMELGRGEMLFPDIGKFLISGRFLNALTCLVQMKQRCSSRRIKDHMPGHTMSV